MLFTCMEVCTLWRQMIQNCEVPFKEATMKKGWTSWKSGLNERKMRIGIKHCGMTLSRIFWPMGCESNGFYYRGCRRLCCCTWKSGTSDCFIARIYRKYGYLDRCYDRMDA